MPRRRVLKPECEELTEEDLRTWAGRDTGYVVDVVVSHGRKRETWKDYCGDCWEEEMTA